MNGARGKVQRAARTRAEPNVGPRVASLGGLARFPVERAQRAVEQVYRSLRRSIILGELAAGSRLREVEVAAAMKASRCHGSSAMASSASSRPALCMQYA